MDTACSLMVERGNTTFQMSEVSRGCGMSKGALYYYFADKEDLLAAVFEEEIHRLVHSIDEAVERAETAEQALHGACTAYAECVHEGAPLAMALMHELVLAREESAPSGTERAIHHIISVVATQLERAKAEGVVRADVDASLMAIASCGAYAFAAMSVSDTGGADAESDFAEVLFRLLVDGFGLK